MREGGHDTYISYMKLPVSRLEISANLAFCVEPQLLLGV